MSEQVSQSEKLDIFLALATFYNEFENESEKNNEFSLSNSVSNLTALSLEEQESLKRKAKRFEKLTPNKQEIWQTAWLEKLRQRGHTQRLDETIHPEQIAEILKYEPLAVQMLIQEKLPDILADKVATVLQNLPLISVVRKKSVSLEVKFPRPNKEIVSLIRQKFLNNFIAFEDLYNSKEIDKLTPKLLGNFIWKLGVREIAIFCRGIKTKEELANFLQEFDEPQAKEIVQKISELENVESTRVTKAEELVNEIFLLETESQNRIRCLGLRLLSIAFVRRDANAQQFTIQKLPIEIGNILKVYLMTAKTEFVELNESQETNYISFGKEINNLAIEFLKDK